MRRPLRSCCLRAICTQAVERQFMALHLKPLRRQPLQVARAGMHIKHARALCALAVVVVRLACGLVAWALAGQLHCLDGAIF